jgi:hypothetical protein
MVPSSTAGSCALGSGGGCGWGSVSWVVVVANVVGTVVVVAIVVGTVTAMVVDVGTVAGSC